MKKNFLNRTSCILVTAFLLTGMAIGLMRIHIPRLFAQTFLTENFNPYADGDLNGAGGWVGDAIFKIQGADVFEGAKAVKITGSGGTGGGITKTVASVADGILSWRIKRSNNAGSVMVYLRDSAGNNVASFGARAGTAQSIMYYDYASGSFNFVAPYSLNTWHLLQVEWRSSDYKVRYRVDSNAWSAWVQRTFNTTNPPTKLLLAIETGGLNSGDIALFDDFSDTSATSDINVKQEIEAIANNGAFSFGDVSTASGLDKEFTIENLGVSNLLLTGSSLVALSGANAEDFSVIVDPSTTILPGSAASFTVRFSPVSVGSKTAQISIASNDPDENPYVITLSGNGTTPAVSTSSGPWSTQGNIVYYNQGTVGIGTSSVPTGYALAVNGKLLTEEVEVKLSSAWPDYVFEPNYTPMPLEELEAYIQANKHLPGVPTQQEVQEQGIQLGEMQRLLTEKVEELTLYVIELQKQNKALQERLDALEQK